VNPEHGIPSETLARINSVLARFPELERAVLFGSRAKGNHKPGSDIDLALSGVDLDWCLVGRIYDALDDLLLPYTFSLITHNAATDPEVAAHIARVGQQIYTSAHTRAKAETIDPRR
jgi:uncharacterized protein